MKGVIQKVAAYAVGIKQKARRSPWERIVFWLYRFFKYAQGKFRSSRDPRVASLYLRSRSMIPTKTSGKWTFVTIAEMAAWTSAWANDLSGTYDLIVGVPRSGLMVASMLACKMGKPLATPEQAAHGAWQSKHAEGRPLRRVLLVDDSVSTGDSMREAKSLLAQSFSGKEVEVHTAALIVAPETKEHVDRYFTVIPAPRIFEWNIFHTRKGVIATDLDGVLCEEYPGGLEDDEVAYREWLRSVRPFIVPDITIDAVVTNRLEKYRTDTEEWLRRNGIRYRALHMWDVATPEERCAGSKARHKVATLLSLKPFMYWESSKKEAEEIFGKTRIPVYCVEENELLS